MPAQVRAGLVGDRAVQLERPVAELGHGEERGGDERGARVEPSPSKPSRVTYSAPTSATATGIASAIRTASPAARTSRRGDRRRRVRTDEHALVGLERQPGAQCCRGKDGGGGDSYARASRA